MSSTQTSKKAAPSGSYHAPSVAWNREPVLAAAGSSPVCRSTFEQYPVSAVLAAAGSSPVCSKGPLGAVKVLCSQSQAHLRAELHQIRKPRAPPAQPVTLWSTFEQYPDFQKSGSKRILLRWPRIARCGDGKILKHVKPGDTEAGGRTHVPPSVLPGVQKSHFYAATVLAYDFFRFVRCPPVPYPPYRLRPSHK